MASSAFAKRWVKPEIYPLMAPIAFAVGLCGFCLVRKVTGDPGITFSKEKRSDGLADDLKSGTAYKMNWLRKYVKESKPEIMPGINRYFAGVREA
eukprot:jgi/Mesen1/6389/ME000329S05551